MNICYWKCYETLRINQAFASKSHGTRVVLKLVFTFFFFESKLSAQKKVRTNPGASKEDPKWGSENICYISNEIKLDLRKVYKY